MSALPQLGRAAIASGKELFERYGVNGVAYGQAPEDQAHRRPFNTVDETVIVRVRNLSALRPRRVEIDHISFFRGGESWAQEQLDKGRQVNLDMLYSQVAKFGDQAKNVQPTELKMSPIDAVLTWNSGSYIVDLYYGNWKRLHEMTPKDRATELENVRARRRDFIIRRPISADFMKESDNEKADKDNDWAFLVFDRKIVSPQAVAVDMERVYSGRALEV